MLGTYHLTALFDTLKEIHFIHDAQKLWKFVLEQSCKTLQSEAGTFYELKTPGKTLQARAAFGMEESRLNALPIEIGVGICGWVAQFGQPALVNDVKQDNRFNGRVDVLTGFKTRSILCVPIFSPTETYGVVEILNKKSGPFSPQDQEFMTLLARQTAIAYRNLSLFQEVTHSKLVLQSVLESLSGGLLILNAAREVSLMNPAAARLLCLDANVALPKPAGELLKDQAWLASTLEQVLTTQQTVSRAETQAVIQGENCRIGYTTFVVRDPLKQVLGAGISFLKLPGADPAS